MSGCEPYGGSGKTCKVISKGYVVISKADHRFTLFHDRQLLMVDARRSGIETGVRLFINDVPVVEGKNWFEPVRLTHDDLIVEVRSTWIGQVTGCVLMRHDGAEIRFTPPHGSHAARLENLARDHPILYASRHVAIALVQLGIGMLGIGAILWALFGQLLPRLGVADWPAPDIELDLPGWLRTIFGIPDRITSVPIGWVRSGYHWLSAHFDLPGWSSLTSTLLSWFQDIRIWIPVVIAVFVTIEEAQRRKRRDAPAEPPVPPGDEASSSGDNAPPVPEHPTIDDRDDAPATGGPDEPDRSESERDRERTRGSGAR